MDSIVRYFTWYIGNVHLWLFLDKYSVRSPTYYFGNSKCKFCLQFVLDRKAQQVNVFVCRCPDGGPKQVETLVSVALKTGSGRVVGSSTFRVSFPKEGYDGLAVTVDPETLLKSLDSEVDKDKVIVTCKSTLLEPTFTFLNEDAKDLSADLLKLRRDSHSANAHLFASGEFIPVHKEIVCSRSPVICERLKDKEYCCENFPAAVLKVMLDYMYYGRFSLKELDDRGIGQLFACALHYEVRDLAKLMAPRTTCVTSFVQTKTETHSLQFSNFSELCKSRCSVEHHKIKMQFNEAVEMSVKIIFEHYNRCGKIRLETRFWNLVNVQNLFLQLFMLDQSSAPIPVQERLFDVTNEEKLMFCWEYESTSLFSRRLSALLNDVLALQYKIRFQFSGQLHISDPDPSGVSEGRPTSHEASLGLVKSMESLVESKLYADAFLVLPLPRRCDVSEAPRVSVHKSILSFRSPVFKDLFRTGQDLYVPLSEWVVKNLLHYAYTGVLLSAGSSTLNELHDAARTYGMDSLKRACEEVAAKMALNIKNVFSIYLIAVRGEMHELQGLCKAFIARNKDLVLGSYRWEKLRRNETAWNEMRRHITSS